VDEVLELENGSLAPLDYKFAEWKGKVWRTHRLQVGFYALLIESEYDRPVRRGFVVYVRSENRVEEVLIDSALREEVQSALREMRRIVDAGWFPKPTRNKRACADCCYRNVCPGARAI
jgi:CRISPR-associated exonuclease Cas4